jgi:putative peptidoglycan binding protein
VSATWPLLRRAVGPALKNYAPDVVTVQQLLNACGFDPGTIDGQWGDKTSTALWAFRSAHNPGPFETRVDPDSEELVLMARVARIEIPLPGERGWDGVRRVHDWFASQGVKYNEGAENGLGNRAIYGLRGRTGSAIQRIDRAWRAGPVQMDCTTYLNLMLGVYYGGNAHQSPYDADCSNFGATSQVHCARDRYGFREVSFEAGRAPRNYVTSTDEMESLAKAGVLYALEVAKNSGSITHMALLRDGVVWECTTKQPASACIRRPIAEFMRNKGRVFMFREP